MKNCILHVLADRASGKINVRHSDYTLLACPKMRKFRISSTVSNQYKGGFGWVFRFEEGILGLMLSSIFIVGGLIIITIQKDRTVVSKKQDPDFPGVEPDELFYIKSSTVLFQEPTEASNKLMDLPQNSKVISLRREDPDHVWWCRVRTIDGTEGWIKDNLLEKRNI
jgi:hypothetical protein